MVNEIYRDRFGAILHDEAAGTLELDWTDESAAMSDDEFMGWLARYADASLSTRVPNLMIDVSRFRFRPGEQVAAWRDEHVIPRYNAAGVRKFAFLLPAGSPGTVATGNEPAPEPPGEFPTGYFDDRAAVDAWFAEG
jgi:hypothetical protein